MIDGVHFSATLPLCWETGKISATLENSRYLAVLAEFEQRGDDLAKEQAELHAKLDLALLWLARSLAGEMPAACQAWIGNEQVCWQSSVPMEVGSKGILAFNLSDALPFLLRLPARVQSCVQAGSLWHICANLEFDDEALRDWWERTVFRRHRRAIQQERGVHA